MLDALAEVYRHDAQTKLMTDAERLLYHQGKSRAVMERLRLWIAEQFSERFVEPNSSLGKALAYMVKHWEGTDEVRERRRCAAERVTVETLTAEGGERIDALAEIHRVGGRA